MRAWRVLETCYSGLDCITIQENYNIVALITFAMTMQSENLVKSLESEKCIVQTSKLGNSVILVRKNNQS